MLGAKYRMKTAVFGRRLNADSRLGAGPAGLFHHFHQRWAVAICDALNAGCLPNGFYALLSSTLGHSFRM